MTGTPLDRIIERTGKVLAMPEIIQPLKEEKPKKAKPPKYNLSEKAFAKQIDEILESKERR